MGKLLLLTSPVRGGHFSDQEIEQKAAEIRKEMQMRFNGSVAHYISGTGGIITWRHGDSAPEGLFVRGDSDYSIYLDRRMDDRFSRFKLAKMLGYYILHYCNVMNSEGRLVVGLQDKQSKIAAREAVQFAANILMPSDLMTMLFNKEQGNLNKMAGVLLLKPQIVQARIEHLGLRLPKEAVHV